jgi:spore maturation protein CgeB
MDSAHTEQDYVDEHERRRDAEARVEGLRAQLDFYRTELRLREQEVRYQLGDALVRAARPSLDTLKLPFRLVRLLLLGLKRRRERRENNGRAALGPAELLANQPHFPPAPLAATPFVAAPSELRRRNDVRVALVADEFSWWAWAFEADTYTFTPRTWKETLQERPPDLLLVESTWHGVGESWHYQIRELGRYPDRIRRYVLPDLVTWCKRHAVPTVFYNKEDPPNFEFFIEAAKLFDYVITSDADCLGHYHSRLGHERVLAMPFAAQPRLNNPVSVGPRTGRVCFAGTWYQHRHTDRQDAASTILRPALDFGLDVYDRNAGTANPNYRWPAAYSRAVRGGLPYAEMLTAYKQYQVFLNVNSVATSPTMFARRVFELLACGTPVISSYSAGIAKLLGADHVLMSTDAAATRRHLERLLGDEDYRARLALRGQRKVFSAHTYAHRLQRILAGIGWTRRPAEPVCLTMIAAPDDRTQVAAALENYRRQTHAAKRLILCALERNLIGEVESTSEAPVAVLVADGAPWGTLLNRAVAAAGGEYLAALHPRHYYGPDYLTDYAHATLYATPPAIGKASFYEVRDAGPPQVANSGHEYEEAPAVNPWTLCVRHKHALACAERLAAAETPEAWWRGVLAQAGSAYSADRFNYVAHNGTAGGGDFQLALA